MDRRGFLKGILAAGIAPYVVTTAGVLMPIRQIITPHITGVLTPSITITGFDQWGRVVMETLPLPKVGGDVAILRSRYREITDWSVRL